MFRVENKPQKINFYEKGKQGLASLKPFHGLAVLLVIIVAVGVWTHGTFGLRFEPSTEELAEAQLQSPMSLDWVELYFGKKICKRPAFCGADADPDKDGLSNYQEYIFLTDPTDPDSDGDNLADGFEVQEYSNPIGSGVTKAVRDVADPYSDDPVGEELLKAGLDQMSEGNLLSLAQIQEAAAKLEQVPAFNDIPLVVNQDNNQAGVDAYLNSYLALTEHYLDDPASAKAATIADSTEKETLDAYGRAVGVYAAGHTILPVPSDLLGFHKASLAKLAFQGLVAETQKKFLEGQIKEDEAKSRVMTLTVYYTRFAQEMAKEADKISQKYNFPVRYINEINNNI